MTALTIGSVLIGHGSGYICPHKGHAKIRKLTQEEQAVCFRMGGRRCAYAYQSRTESYDWKVETGTGVPYGEVASKPTGAVTTPSRKYVVTTSLNRRFKFFRSAENRRSFLFVDFTAGYEEKGDDKVYYTSYGEITTGYLCTALDTKIGEMVQLESLTCADHRTNLDRGRTTERGWGTGNCLVSNCLCGYFMGTYYDCAGNGTCRRRTGEVWSCVNKIPYSEAILKKYGDPATYCLDPLAPKYGIRHIYAIAASGQFPFWCELYGSPRPARLENIKSLPASSNIQRFEDESRSFFAFYGDGTLNRGIFQSPFTPVSTFDRTRQTRKILCVKNFQQYVRLEETAEDPGIWRTPGCKHQN